MSMRIFVLFVPLLIASLSRADCSDDGNCKVEDPAEEFASLLQFRPGHTALPFYKRLEWLKKQGCKRKPLPIAGKSIYFILVDRFARSDGNNTRCGYTDGYENNNWCNGTILGIINHLDYIQGMGFDGIWITPIVEQRPGKDGQSGYPSHGYWAKNIYEVDFHYGTKAQARELADQLHARGMFFILDIVANHMGPVHSVEEVATFYPFNKPEYYHQLGIGDLTFDEYTEKNKDWPPPTQCQGPGALCAKNQRDDCGCYNPACGGAFQPACDPEHMVFNQTSVCPEDSIDSICRPGAYSCLGYNETVVHEGWFFDLGDLNQSNPFVWSAQLKWANWLRDEYLLDGIRLDTTPYMRMDFLSALQRAAKVPILGEVTATNLSFHASFQANPPPSGNPVLDGVLNFPLTYVADAAFCGNWFPYASLNLSTLALRTTEQLHGGFYKDLDLLGNFVDNQDMVRLTELCTKEEMSRQYNALAWTFFTKGMPIIYYGTEEFMESQRGSFWQFGWNTNSVGYGFIKKLNLIRKLQNIALKQMEVVATANAPKEQLVLRRGGTHGTYAFLNNYAQNRSDTPVHYCIWEFPPAQKGKVWVDGISGNIAYIEAESCFVAENAAPKILIQVDTCGQKHPARPNQFIYDLGCEQKPSKGCKADGVRNYCRLASKTD